MSNNKFQFVDVEILDDKEDENHISKESIKNDIEVVSSPEKINMDSKKDEVVNTVDLGKRWYFSFESRVIISVIIIILLFIGACFLGLGVINHTSIDNIDYKENADFTYQVCMKDGSCKPENSVYMNEDISSILISYNYDAKYAKKTKTHSYYKITSTIRVANPTSHALIYQKDIDIVDKSKLYIIGNTTSVSKNVKVDYTKYKAMIEEYKDCDNTLEIAFYVVENNETRKASSLQIPISLDSFELHKYTNANTKRTAEVKVNIWDVYSIVYGITSSILVIISLILVYKTTRLVLMVTNNKNEYEDAVEAILKEYDNVIIVARDGYESMVEREIIKVEDFKELVEIRDKIDKPIIFSKVNNVKCEFIVEDDKILYKYVMKEVDIEEK
ncbi:MAG: hypothetical protein IK137_03725 [Bacilli bacterium]|nr:hypothetical protein [Bacilli bacterium]